MKAILFSVLLVAFSGMYSVNAQVEMLKSAEETARQLDELEGKSTPQRRENGENSSRYEYPDNNRSQEENDRLRERWDETFEFLMGKFRKCIDKFETSETRCIFIMVIYLDAYMDLVEATDAEQDTRLKCNGYAMQSIAIAAGASIMYCPESLANKTAIEKKRIWNDDLLPILANEENDTWITEWEKRLERVTRLNFSLNESINFQGPEHINNMVRFFHPNYIITQLLDIQQNMEVFNCPE